MHVEILLAFGIEIVALAIGISIVMTLLAGKRVRKLLTRAHRDKLNETRVAGFE